MKMKGSILSFVLEIPSQSKSSLQLFSTHQHHLIVGGSSSTQDESFFLDKTLKFIYRKMSWNKDTWNFSKPIKRTNDTDTHFSDIIINK